MKKIFVFLAMALAIAACNKNNAENKTDNGINLGGESAAVFTVGDHGEKVIFAPGNLKASTTDGWKTWTYSFMEHQYDLVETNGEDYCEDDYANKAEVSLFGWGTWGSGNRPNITSVMTGDYPWKVFSENLLGYDNWRTPTMTEWANIIFYRETGGTVNGTAQARFTMATVAINGDSIKGLILFPDGYAGGTPEGVTWGKINEGTDSHGTSCTLAGWDALEAAGCVFLPSAGYRNDNTVASANVMGCYWSSELASAYEPYYLYFRTERPYLECDDCAIKHNGLAVRLVRDL